MKRFKKTKKSKTVFAAMSGGVDSSTAALLLKKQKCDVIGVFIRSYNIDGCEERDAEDARRVAGKLEIPFYVWDFEEEYKKKVVDYMIGGYRRGITPNPDVMCNKEIKFGLFLKKALEMGADCVATGHYVRLVTIHRGIGHRDNKRKNLNPIDYTLMVARDAQKDQSYFLWTLTQEQLKHCLFPIGNYLKSEVREIARKAGLPTAEKKDSQGICFLGKVKFKDFLKQYISEKKGDVLLAVTSDKNDDINCDRKNCHQNKKNEIKYKKIGEHTGAQFYTIGQRHIGCQISGIKKGQNASCFKPFYIADKNMETNTLIIAEGSDNPALYKKEIKLKDINFINPNFPSLMKHSSTGKLNNKNLKIFARIRYRQPLAKATVKIKNSKTYKLIFDKPQKFVASGQSAVFYLPTAGKPTAPKTDDKNYQMLGGGIIV